MRKLNAILIIAMAFVLAAPCIALAGKKKRDTSEPSISEIVVTKRTDKSSTKLFDARKNTGQTSNKANGASGGVKDSHDRY